MDRGFAPSSSTRSTHNNGSIHCIPVGAGFRTGRSACASTQKREVGQRDDMAASLLLLSLESESAALIAQRQDELLLLALLEWRSHFDGHPLQPLLSISSATGFKATPAASRGDHILIEEGGSQRSGCSHSSAWKNSSRPAEAHRSAHLKAEPTLQGKRSLDQRPGWHDRARRFERL